MGWKCPACGRCEDASPWRCVSCGTVFVPACIVLTSKSTGRTLRCTGDTKVGRALLHARLADPDALYAAERQFELVRDDTGWRLRHEESAPNATLYNGAIIPDEGILLTEGGTITLGKTRLGVRVGFEG